MRKAVKTYRPMVVFSQWKRKGYAVLASLDKHIKIGHLSVRIIEIASLKNGISQHCSVPDLVVDQASVSDDEGEWPPPDAWSQELEMFLSLIGISLLRSVKTIMSPSSCDHPSYSITPEKITAPLAPDNLHLPKGLFCFTKINIS